MQLSKSTQTSLSEINMVPFVDVVLVLLIIFMITAPILQSGIEVDVPKTKTVKEISQDRLVLTFEVILSIPSSCIRCLRSLCSVPPFWNVAATTGGEGTAATSEERK